MCTTFLEVLKILLNHTQEYLEFSRMKKKKKKPQNSTVLIETIEGDCIHVIKVLWI